MSKKRAGYINPSHHSTHMIGHTEANLPRNWFIKNPTALLDQYDNLIRKLGKKYSANFNSYDDDEDLFAYITEAFTELAMEYDSYGGVDFPGYIVKKLPLRIKYSYITKQFLRRKRIVMLHSDQYSIRDLLNLIQDHGEGQVTLDKHHRISRIQGASHIDLSFKERLIDIIHRVPMDALDSIIFIFLVDGFSKYSYIIDLVNKYSKRHHLHYEDSDIRFHVRELKKRLRNYYLQIPDSPVILKDKSKAKS